MKLAQIKNIIKESDSDIHELDLVLSIEHLLSNYRSAFLDQRIYGLSKSEFKTLRSYMTKAIDVKEVNGELISYFFVPIVLSALPSSGYASVIDNVDAKSLQNIISRSNVFQDEVRLSNVVMPRSTIFGGNIYSIFDIPRVLLSDQDNFYVGRDQLIDESQNQYVYYAVGYEKGGLTEISDEDWYDKMHFIESKFTKYTGVEVSIMPPKRPSEEIYASLFTDLWIRLSSSLKLSSLCSINRVELVIDSKTADSTFIFYEGENPLASVCTGSIRELDKDIVLSNMHDFVSRHDLGEAALVKKSAPELDKRTMPTSSRNAPKKSKAKLTVVK